MANESITSDLTVSVIDEKTDRVTPCHNGKVILEQAVLSVRPGQEAEFEAAFEQAKSIIASAPGFEGITLWRCIERTRTYLLLVEWARLEDHLQGFRESGGYLEWRRLLHHFYEPFPTVEHYVQVQEAGPR